MSQLNAIQATKFIKDRLLDFCRSDHYVTDQQVEHICQYIWSNEAKQGGLVGDLWVEAAFPPRSSAKSMRDHVDDGLISHKLADLLDKNKAFVMDWDLREIQADSVKLARAADASESKPAITVSASTGAGKTESFLFPMLDDLIRNPGTAGNGASALILYPMNALVADQVERLTHWLGGQNDLRIFHFTGDTPEDHRSANYKGYPNVDQCCFRTRQEARGFETATGKGLNEANRGSQPDVIVTNYSMLEYMLCRPQDAVFFGNNLRHLVLDEAHLYTGNLAAEITMLLRRLAAKCGVASSSITHYATSATLVEGTVDEQKKALANFSAKVFSKKSDAVHVILGKKAEATVAVIDDFIATEPASSPTEWPDLSGIAIENDRDVFVGASEEEWTQWMDALSQLFPGMNTNEHDEREIAPFLFKLLPQQAVFQQLYHHLYDNKIVSLKDLSQKIWASDSEGSLESTRRLLQAGAIAREAASLTPLLPNRVHWSIKAPNGLFFSFAHEHAPSQEQVYTVEGVPVGYFYSPGYFSRPEDDKSHPLLVMRNGNKGQWILAGVESGGKLKTPGEGLPKTQERAKKLIERLSFFALGNCGDTVLEFDHLEGTLGVPGTNKLTKIEFSEVEKKTLKPFGSDSRLQLVIVAEAALTQMPPFPDDSKRWKPAEGRRMLVFSDSRREAATLGPAMTFNHERQLFRALVTTIIKDTGAQSASELHDKIEELKGTLDLVPDAAKEVIEQSIEIYGEKLQDAQEGLKPEAFVEELAKGELLQEFFDREKGLRNKAASWGLADFEANKNKVAKTLFNKLGQELARRTLWPDLNLESAGILELAYPGIEELKLSPDYLGTLPDAQLRESLNQNFPAYLGMVLDHIRDLGAITFGSPSLDAEYGIGGGYIAKWVSLESRFKNSVLPLITTKENSLLGNFTSAFLTAAGMDLQDDPLITKNFIEEVFRNLYANKVVGKINWIEFDQRQTDENQTRLAMRILFKELRIRKPDRLYQCSESGQVWARSALGFHLRSSHASLVAITEEDIMKNPRIARVRREWGDSPVFKSGLWAEEHSAQIAPSENRRLQDLFKAGIRNVLSSTTTLELGIDIGGLNGVMMGNIPPNKASYLQRAGRAGRRADGSALVISYSRNKPYERKVFEDFAAYLDQPLREPVVFLDRVDIICRHFHSLLFGYFFGQAYSDGSTTGAMQAFGRMGAFTNVPQTGYWGARDLKPTPQSLDAQRGLVETFPWGDNKTSIASALQSFLEVCENDMPGNLEEQVNALIIGTALETEAKEHLGDLVKRMERQVHKQVSKWQDGYQDLLEQWIGIANNADVKERIRANALHHQLRQMFGTTLIEYLSDGMILPRYGFPIGLSELKVNQGKISKKDDHNDAPPEAYRLNRSASQAVSEYAPGSKLLVGAKIVHSQGILKSWTGNDIPMEGMGLRAWFHWNEKTGEFKYDYTIPETEKGAQLVQTTNKGAMLFIKHGFTTAASECPTFGGKPQRVGEILNICRPPEDESLSRIFERFAGISGMKARLHVGGELIAMNGGEYGQGFVVCTKCGYSASEYKSLCLGRADLPKRFEWHTSIHETNTKFSCWKSDETLVLRNLHLAARQVCDFVEIELPHLTSVTNNAKRIANTICQALRMSGADILKIDSRELSILKPSSGDKIKISICDSLAGGAGHVRDLCEMAKEWWEAACAMIHNGSPTSAMLDLLTSDAPVKDGLPYFCIESTREYLSGFSPGDPPLDLPDLEDSHDSDTEEGFNPEAVSQHFKKKTD